MKDYGVTEEEAIRKYNESKQGKQAMNTRFWEDS